MLSHFLQGRSHRALPALQQLQTVLSETRILLEIPESHQIAIVPGSATAAFEMGIWNFLDACGADVWSFDVFGRRWAAEIRNLPLSDLRFFDAEDGQLPDFSQAHFARDQVVTWCGTTSGVWLEGTDWITPQRTGLTLCDATSAVFTTTLPWALMDVTAFSWQKGLGSEAGHGMIVLSPRAIERLRQHTPSWPIPRMLRLRDDPLITQDTLEGSIFAGFTLNTPSLLAVADCLWALDWAKAQGGAGGLLARVATNFQQVERWVSRTPWISFLAQQPVIRAKSAVCLVIQDPWFSSLENAQKWVLLREMADILANQGVAFDLLNHTSAKPCFRLWCGPTVEAQDLERLFPWLEWAFKTTKTRALQQETADHNTEENTLSPLRSCAATTKRVGT